ncbi:uncharacterized protein PHALS_09912 [Plasmopara halstedii]|uniref:Uncharacterized protein n=1 Tax=Plasmopara halstedii TaxID=4781 RepID=A0A0N7L4U8_PLAHL|nr:uncharacterized protein PHALS_09912 [Plasmopara halstedii]CEG39675.1 hypothetical protein PHALS_09912 [Plasmopara halstedii]|eukprot:XP_024576044.1 hypothetical protein PHALS_09912 [Plasmopara halstedii]
MDTNHMESHRLSRKQRSRDSSQRPAAGTSTRAKVAFGSRLPYPKTKVNIKAKRRYLIQAQQERDGPRPNEPKKLGRFLSQNEAPECLKVKSMHRPLVVKNISAPTKVVGLKSSNNVIESVPWTTAFALTKDESAEHQKLIADALTPVFWIKRREKVEASLKLLDAIEKRARGV